MGEGMAEKAAQWNKAMNKFQKALIKAGGADSSGPGSGQPFNVVGLVAEEIEAEADLPAVAAAKASKKALQAAFTKETESLLTSLTALSENEEIPLI